MKPKGVGDPKSKGSFTLESLRLGLNLSVTLLLGFDIIITLLRLSSIDLINITINNQAQQFSGFLF